MCTNHMWMRRLVKHSTRGWKRPSDKESSSSKLGLRRATGAGSSDVTYIRIGRKRFGYKRFGPGCN